MTTTHEATSPSDPLTERLDRLARGEAARTAAWPGLDGAIHHDRRVRAVRRGAVSVVAACLAVAVALPFSPIRVQPLDALAASIGLVDRGRDDSLGRSLRQDVSADAVPYRDKRGPARPALSGTPILDAAWRRQAVARVVQLSPLGPTMAADTEILWAVDDGTWVRAVAGFSPSGSTNAVLLTLTGRSNAAPDDLLLSTTTSAGDITAGPGASGAAPRTVALTQGGAREVAVSPSPDVDESGTVSFTWYDLHEAVPGIWVGDLPDSARGWVYSMTGDDGVRFVSLPGECECDERAMRGGGEAETFLARSWLGRYADLGHDGVSRSLRYEVPGEPSGQQVTVRIAGVRTPGGGWLVSGDLRYSSKEEGAESEGGSDLDVVASAAPRGGGTPFVGFAPKLTDESSGYVVLWAPAGVATVRSGSVTAPVRDGVALLDLRLGGERVNDLTPDQAVLVEGLDASGRVVVRTKVNEPWEESTTEDGDEPVPSDAALAGLVRATNRWVDK